MRIKHKMIILVALISMVVFSLNGLIFGLLENVKTEGLQNIRQTIEKMSPNLENSDQERKGELLIEIGRVSRNISRTQTILWAAVFGVLFTFFGFVYYVSRRFLTPIRQMSQITERLAVGDFLSESPAVQSNDELGDLYGNIIQIKQDLGRALRDIYTCGTQVATAAEQLLNTSKKVVADPKGQNEKEEIITGATDLMNSTTQNVAQNASESLRAAEEMVRFAELGNQKTSETIANMNKILKILNEAGVMGGTVSRKAQEIGEITAAVNSTVEQTQLMTFNAVFGAAHAGEEGSGFAEVADEVRKLSEKTSRATKEIVRTITEIQQESGDNVATMCEGIEMAEEGTQHLKETEEALQEILRGANRVKEMVQQIAAASQEEGHTSEQITLNAHDISLVVKETIDGSEETRKVYRDLALLTSELRERLSYFRINP